MRATALLLLLTGCVTVGPGLPLTTLPANVAWCGGAPLPVQNVTRSAERAAFPNDFISPGVVGTCGQKLGRYQALSEKAWEGSIIFGVTSDERGVVTDLCVWGGNFGNAREYVACVVEEVTRAGPVVPPNLAKQHWRLTYIRD